MRGSVVLYLLILGAGITKAQIGVPSLLPSAISVNTASPVVVTVELSNPRIISSSVNLQREDANGHFNVIATMNDGGHNGDALAGDGIYATHVLFNETGIGLIQLRVSAAVQGTVQRLVSTTVSLEVTDQTIPNRPAASDISQVAYNARTGTKVVTNQLLVRFAPSVTPDMARLTIAAAGGTLVGRLPSLAIYQAQFTTSDISELNGIVDRLGNSPSVQKTDFIFLVKAFSNIPDDIRPEQYYLKNINAQGAWNTTTGLQFGIGVIDSGANFAHPDLTGKLIPGYDFVDTDADPSDKSS